MRLRETTATLVLAGALDAGCLLTDPYADRFDGSVDVTLNREHDTGRPIGTRPSDATVDVVHVDPPPPEYFTPCTAPGMCQGTMARCDNTFPGGSCTIRCTTARACGEGATCVIELNQCYRTCTLGGGECGVSGVCVPYNETTRFCFPACYRTPPAGVAACNPGTLCNVYAGACLDASDLPPGADNGGPCTGDDDCKSQQCLTETDEADGSSTGFLGGFCVSYARYTGQIRPGQALPEGNCPPGSAGIPMEAGAGAGDQAICFATCTPGATSRCRPGYECDNRFFDGTMQPTNGICSPIDCLAAPHNAQPNNDCPAGYECRTVMGPTRGVCTRSASADAGAPDATVSMESGAPEAGD